MDEMPPLDSGTGWDSLLAASSKRSEASLALAKQLLAEGHSGPALVWAVRAVEIFLKEFVLPASFVSTDPHAEWERAVRKARNHFDTLKWDKAFKKINEAFGPLDPMQTESGRDASEVWNKNIVVARHHIVHGREEASLAEAAEAIRFADQLTLQLKLRLIVAGEHPLSDVFKSIYNQARAAYQKEQRENLEPDA